jgi:type II secretory pathway component GspD/PulD (secretin)
MKEHVMKRATILPLLILISLLVPACNEAHVRRFDYQNIHLEVSGRVAGGEAVAAATTPESGFARFSPTKQIFIEAKIVEVGLDETAILGVQWWSGAGDPLDPTRLTDTSPEPMPVNVGVGFGIGLGGGGGGNDSYPDQRDSSGGGFGVSPGVSVPLDLGGDGITSVEAMFDLPLTTSIDDSFLMIMIALEKAQNGKIISQPILIPFETFTAQIPDEIPPEQEAATTVLVQSGNTILIGGLKRMTEQEVVSEIPQLGDLPLLGRLFQNNQLVEHKELLIFVTPRIIVTSD